uniref:GDSL esterase/lipase At2g04570-like n=1 Tax=Papaver somniferum TaxID=3469 RepID=A0A5B7LJS3_PAPSO|nr:GDSL esterase/lipase At2g04570-like [Papaver somniferum]
MSTQYSLLVCVLHILVFSVLEITGTKKFPALIVFGDSTVDAGNNNQIPTLAKSNFLPYGQDFEGGKPTGRFCNGRLATDFLAEMLGIKDSIPAYLDPAFGIEDFATGVTFASAATGYDVATSNLLAVIPLSEELEYFKEYLQKLSSFLGKDGAVERARESLYFISIGTNDFILNYFTVPGRSSHFTVDEYEDFLLGTARNFLIELYSLGARKIVLTGLPPSGYLPVAKTLNHVSGIPNLEELNEAMCMLYHKGFENTEEGCCGTETFEFGILCKAADALSCPDPSKYVFWDSVHPSEKVYNIMANVLMDTTISQFLK